ncbi:D-xylose ABC transporter ATP-binding protein, partial [Pseudomonas quasicaspiana]|nr:D-xylose ABC transporter ATP-binding protein [Pseudomonas quasicaspiana]
KYEIYKLMGALAAAGVSIIMVSSELAEVLGVSDRVLAFADDQHPVGDAEHFGQLRRHHDDRHARGRQRSHQ